LSRWSLVLWPPPTSHPASSWISLHQLIPVVTMAVNRRPSETSPPEFHSGVPSPTFTASRSPYAGGFLTTAFPGSSPLLWPSPCMKGSAPSCSPCGANISTLQDSLHVTGCCFAPLSQGVTTLRHSQSPGCTGCLLSGGLTLTRTGLSPASRR
jgi:hypothetical protein